MRNAFCTFVYGKYYRFLPYYIFSISKNYPETAILILYNGKIPDGYKKTIKGYTNIFLFEDVANDFEWLNNLKHRGAAKQTLRHILKLDVFNDFDAIYFGDVDILYLDEKYDLFDFHSKQAMKSGLPFSNRVRPMNDNPMVPSTRLTGLHFIKVKPYYQKMNSIIDRFVLNEEFRNDILKKSNRNENVLYFLCMEAFHFNPLQIMKNERPWHGFHLGLVRGKDYLNISTIEENSSLSIEDLKLQLSELNKNGDIDRLLLKYKCTEVYHTYKYFDLKLGNQVKVKYLFSKIIESFLKKLKKLKSKLKNA